MKKNLLLMWVFGIIVIALTCVCMVLLFAEPAECENWKQFVVTLVAMKLAAIVCGVVAFLAGWKISDSEGLHQQRNKQNGGE